MRHSRAHPSTSSKSRTSSSWRKPDAERIEELARMREDTMRIALAAAGVALFAGGALAQPAVQPPMAVPPLIDWAKVEIKVTDLGNKTYMLTSAGGNITFAVGSDAIIMVDGQYAPLSDRIKAAIKDVSPLPIRYMVNTHFHGDHTGGN